MKNTYDNSQVSAYQKCPFSYYLQYVVGLRRNVVDDSNAAMHFGSIVHEWLDAHYSNNFSSFTNKLKDYKSPDGLPSYSINAVEYFTSKYKEKYVDDDSGFDFLEVERCSKFDIGGYEFIVKKDGAYKDGDKVYCLEHKTCKSIGDRFWDKFQFSSQIPAQIYSTIKDYGQCNGVLLNAIEVKYLKRKPTARSYFDFIKHGDGWLTTRFERDWFNYSEEGLDDWVDNTVNWIDRIEESKDSGIWEKSRGSWGGIICAGCEYAGICMTSHGNELDEYQLGAEYEVVDGYKYLKGGDDDSKE